MGSHQCPDPRGDVDAGAIGMVLEAARTVIHFPLLALSLPTSPLRFEYLSTPAVAALFLLLAIPIIRLGKATLHWHSPRRGWTSIGVRLAAIWVIIMILAGARWERRSKDLDVVVLRDISTSTAAVPHPRGKTLGQQIDEYLKSAASSKPNHDRIGVVSFDDRPLIDWLPDTRLRPGSSAVRDQLHAGGTDVAAAVQLGLASFRGDAMRRLVLVSDGNPTQGDTQAAVNAALSAGVPIDVIPLSYRVGGEVLIDRLIAPACKREGDAFTLDCLFRSTNDHAVRGEVEICDRHHPLDLDPQTPGMQSTVPVTIRPGGTSAYVKLPAMKGGVHVFTATFIPESPDDDALAGNNVADAMTVVRGRMRVLYVDHTGDSMSSGSALLDTLRRDGVCIEDEDHITPDAFPSNTGDLESYDAVVMANVPRGAGGLNPQQERALVQYVRDLGGGLVMIGGPEALGAGQWPGSELETILPLDMDPPPRRIVPPGALVLVLDHSGSMADRLGHNPSIPKQQMANQSAVLALETLKPEDYVGVVAFDTTPSWVVPFGPNANPEAAMDRVRDLTPAGGTSIYPALKEAVDALLRLPPENARIRHILLMTDGVSADGDYEGLLRKMSAARISLSTIAVGSDADRDLLSNLARRAGGQSYNVRDANQLSSVFVREARTLRRPLIHEPPEGIEVANAGAVGLPLRGIKDLAFPKLTGMVLTGAKPYPSVHIPLRTATSDRDPILATWSIGMGHAAIFTSDAGIRWSQSWTHSPTYGKFWPQLIRSMARTRASGEFDVRTVRNGTHTKLIVDASADEGAARNFLTMTGRLVGPDPRKASTDVHLQQTGPGRYEADLDTPDAGCYFAALQYRDPTNESTGTLLTGTIVPSAPELRDLVSNDALLAQAAEATGGRVLPAFDSGRALFDREGLRPAITHRPLRETLLCMLMSILIIDVGVRRIAWNWQAIAGLMTVAGQQVQSFVTTRRCEPAAMLTALRRVRHDVVKQQFKPSGPVTSGLSPLPVFAKPASPTVVEKCLTPSAPCSQTGSLWEAKRRAQVAIHDIETAKMTRR